MRPTDPTAVRDPHGGPVDGLERATRPYGRGHPLADDRTGEFPSTPDRCVLGQQRAQDESVTGGGYTPSGQIRTPGSEPVIRGYEILGELGHGGMGVVQGPAGRPSTDWSPSR